MQMSPMETHNGRKSLTRLLISGLWLQFLVTTAAAELRQPIEDWYDPAVPVFASDLILAGHGTAGPVVYVVDQITAQIFRVSPEQAGGADQASIDSVGFAPTREEILSLMASKRDFSLFLEGEIKLEREGNQMFFFDGRRRFGSQVWFELHPEKPNPVQPSTTGPMTILERTRDQAMLADAVAELAGKGKRVRPWRWSMREETFQLIDQRGRAFLFAIDSALFGQKRLRLIVEVDSLFSRLMDFIEAELSVEDPDRAHLTLGHNRWIVSPSEDPYTDDRVLALLPDTATRTFVRETAARKNKPNLPAGWTEYFRQVKLLADGPAGQLIAAQIRLTHQGLKHLLILSRDGQTRIVPWNSVEPPSENVVTLPEGFLVPDPPHWKLIGWTPEFNGIMTFGNSRFQRIAPVLVGRPKPAADVGDVGTWGRGAADPETLTVTAGLLVLDAEEPSITMWPATEWPRMMTSAEIHLFSEPIDLTVSKFGEVFVMAREADGSLRVFRISDVIEPVLELREGTAPEFLPGGTPTVATKTETRHSLWNIGGQPPSLMKKETFDILWHAGEGISWRYEHQNVILFSTDPTGESDTAITIQIEGVTHVKTAVKQNETVWLLETDSGILRLDAGDPMAPEIAVIEVDGLGLRYSPNGAIYTVPVGGSSEVRQIGRDGGKQILGRFKETWVALGSDGTRLFFKDGRTSKFFVVQANMPFDPEFAGQITGQLDFNYDDPASVLLCAVGAEAYCMMVRPKAPTFLLGPLPYGSYRIDVSAGPADLSSPGVFAVNQAEVEISDVKLTKSLDFIFRRAQGFEEQGNPEMAKFNYELYLSLYPTGRARDAARSGLLKIYAAENRMDAMISFYRAAPPETNWSAEALNLMLDRAAATEPDRMEIARKILSRPAADAHSAELLFFLYRRTLDPAYKNAVRSAGIPPVYSRFFESFDRARL